MCSDPRGADTIAAIATPPGEGGIAIVRVSGPDARAALDGCFRRRAGGALRPRRMHYGHVVDGAGDVVDEAMAAFFPGPHSYTAEDVAEIHCHGGAVAARRVLAAVTAPGPWAVRLARPGEFTQRAFLNGRIDLSEAEAVMALIRSGSDAAARSAVRQMRGGVSRFVSRVRDRLTELMAAIEAGNDFPDEIDEEVARGDVLTGIAGVRGELARACDERAARIVRDGLSVALVGAPNVGKSSLMNALLGQDRAIVTGVPGTTRDVLTERLRIGALVVELSDTAGQRQGGGAVERIGIQRALDAERAADVVLLVLDASRPMGGEDREILSRADDRCVVVLNKMDLLGGVPAACAEAIGPRPFVALSAATGEGVDVLLAALEARVGAEAAGEDRMTAARHIDCARAALEALDRAEASLQGGHPIDLAAVDLMEALCRMTEITGESASEGVIDGVFARFCVGK